MAKIKINKLKFIRNILICVVAVFIVALILNIAPGYKRNIYGDKINLVLNEKNITEDLKNSIYVSEKGTIYLSIEDIKNIFDSNIYHDKKYNQIITTSDTKVANISINEKNIIINDTTEHMLEPVIKVNDEIYIPISDLSLVYNIQVNYIKTTNIVVIDNLDKGLIKADASENTEIKYKPRALSKTIGELKEGDTVTCFYTTSKGWREIRTSEGVLGYIKANKLTNEYILRQDMDSKKDAKEVSIKANKNGEIYVDNKKIELVNLYSINDENDEVNIWGNVSTKNLQDVVETVLGDYKQRTTIINKLVSIAVSKKVSNINLDFDGTENVETIKRFVIEIAPKLREIGITTSIVQNENINKQDYLKIVDYIVTEK